MKQQRKHVMNYELMVLAMMAVGFLAAKILPNDCAAGPYKAWTEADFDYVVKRYLK
jgi:hypothetical protein